VLEGAIDGFIWPYLQARHRFAGAGAQAS